MSQCQTTFQFNMHVENGNKALLIFIIYKTIILTNALVIVQQKLNMDFYELHNIYSMKNDKFQNCQYLLKIVEILLISMKKIQFNC